MRIEEHPLYTRGGRIERDGEKYGTYLQAVRSYRKNDKVKQDVVHLGQHSSFDGAFESWPKEIKELKEARPNKAKKLQENLERLKI